MCTGMPQHIFNVSQYVQCYCSEVVLPRLWLSSCYCVSYFFKYQRKINFYAPQLLPAGTAEARISYGDSVRLSVCLSQAGTEPSPGEIETPGLHHMVAWSI